MQIVECVPNVSEGRRAEVLDQFVRLLRAQPGVVLLDYHSVAFFTENFIDPGLPLSLLRRAPMEVVYTWALFFGHVTTLATCMYLFRQIPVSWPPAFLAASLHTFNYTRLLPGYSHLHVVYDAPALLAVAELLRWYRSRRLSAAVFAGLALAVQFFFIGVTQLVCGPLRVPKGHPEPDEL